MKIINPISFILLTVSCITVFSCGPEEKNAAEIKSQVQSALKIRHGEPIHAIKSFVLDSNKVELGQRLFNEPMLSSNNTVSCTSCHDLENGGADNKKTSMGIMGNMGEINTPTVFNSAHNFAQFWNGRAENLTDQIEGPINNDMELGSSWSEIIPKLKKDPSYEKQFGEIYKTGITQESIKDALVEFEKSLVTPSAFDKYLLGDDNAIDSLAIEGYALFKKNGCIVCHQGQNVGGNMYQKLGITGDYFKARGGPITEADLGRYNVTGKEEDKFYFKVPTLRNVALTAPYFHDGSAQDLKSAIKTMAKYQVGRPLTDDEVMKIEAFLNSLTGERLK